MAMQADRVSASRMRQRIPPEWQMEFQDWTAEALLSLASDVVIRRQFDAGTNVWFDPRAWASWELDYRIAFEIADAPDELPVPLKGRK